MSYRTIYQDELYHHGVKGMKWGVRKKENESRKTGSSKTPLDVRLIGKSFKVNEAVENAKASAWSKVGAKGIAKTHQENAKYYKKISDDLTSGKIAPAKTKYQKFARMVGRSKFAENAIKNSKDLTPQQKAQALAEQKLMRMEGGAKGIMKRKAASIATDAAIGVGLKVAANYLMKDADRILEKDAAYKQSSNYYKNADWYKKRYESANN